LSGIKMMDIGDFKQPPSSVSGINKAIELPTVKEERAPSLEG